MFTALMNLSLGSTFTLLSCQSNNKRSHDIKYTAASHWSLLKVLSMLVWNKYIEEKKGEINFKVTQVPSSCSTLSQQTADLRHVRLASSSELSPQSSSPSHFQPAKMQRPLLQRKRFPRHVTGATWKSRDISY